MRVKNLIPLLYGIYLLTYFPLFAQLSGTYTVGAGGNYATIAAAIADLNAQGVGSGGVTFNVAAGHSENITSALTITATGTASNPIVFQKSGAGANPIITRTDAGTLITSVIGGAGDAVVRLEGTDYITFNGIDVAATDQGIEYGYLTHKPSGTDGCQFVTIQNCNISMTKGTSGYVIGIYIGNGTTSTSSATGVTVTAASGINSNISIIGNTIQNVHAGVYVRGSSATGFYDSDVVVGQSGAGNTITNFGGGSATTTYGVYFIYVNNPTVSYNTISSATHGSILYGIFYSSVTGTVIGSNNAFTLANNSTSSATYFLYNGSAVTSEDFSNNTFAAGTLSSTGSVYLIYASNATPNKTINNNQISGNINRTGASGYFYCYYNFGSPSSGTETITNNNFSNISVSGSSALYGIYTYTATGQNRVCSGNTVSNLTGGTGFTYAIYVLSSNSNQVYNNNVYNITAGGTVYGLYFTGTNPTVYNNIVRDITTNGSTLYGIYDGGTGTTNCYQNQVYNLTNNNTSATLYGFYITTGTANYVYNNFVSDLKTPSSGSTTGLAGMYVSGGTSVGLYYNTVFLNASSTGTNFGSSGIYASTTPTLDLRNNVVVNLSTPAGTGFTVAYRRSTTTLTSYSSLSNNNDFYAGTPSATNLIFYDGTNSDQTISAYKARVAPRDAASFSENPPFKDISSTPYDLHIDESTSTQIESGGTPITSPIAINTDFDGNTRNATTPDVGADEFNGIGLDLTPPTISYSLLGNGIVATSRTFSNVTITDPSGVNTSTGTKPRVYYKKSTDPNDNTGWKYVEADNSSSPFSFTIDYSLLTDGSVSIGDSIQYFVVAQDLAPTPNVGINSGIFANPQSSVDLQADAFPISGTINSYAIVGTISGTVTVGTGGNYPSLTGAGGLFAAINGSVVSGNITAMIISDLSEDGSNALNQWTESPENSNFTLTIVPNDASTKNITGSYSGGLIRLNGADRVTIDGRYSGSGNYLNFVNTATSGSIAPLQIISSGTGQGAEDITISNCTFSNGYIGTTTYGIFAGSSTLGTAGADNDNLTIRDNIVKKSYYGIYVAGTAAGVNNNLSILNNEVGSNTPADYVYKYGIYVEQAINADISGNHIFNMSSTTYTPVGMQISTGVTNSTISKNHIHNIAYTGTGGYGGRGMYINTGSTSSNLTIHNNVIYDIKGDGWSTFPNSSMVGIYVDGTTGGLNIYYNTINMYGDFARNTATVTAAMLFYTSTISNVDLRNNVFVNSMNNTTVTTEKNYAIYSVAGSSAFTNINYNDYYSSGPQGVLGYLGSDLTTLSDWQTATGQDGNSNSADPLFVANNDLRPNIGSPVLAAGTPISGITTDFLGTTRSSTNPSMGAYEEAFTPTTPPNCPNLTSPANSATGVSTSPTFTWTDGGGGTTGYKFYLGTDNPPTNIINGADLGNVTTYNYSGTLNYSTQYYWRVVSYNANGDATGCEIRSFTTTSDPSLLPKYETFDNVTPPDLPAGWSKENTNGDANTWNTAADIPRSAPNAIKYIYNSTNAANDWFFTPGLNLTGGVTYEVSFWYKAYSASFAEKLKVMWGTSASSSAMTNGPIWDNNNIINTTYQQASGTFTPSSSGTFYIGWHCYSDPDMWNLYVDDISIRVQPAATDTQTIAGGFTNPVTFTGTGATMQFTVANTGAIDVLCERINSSPGVGSGLPSGVQNLGPVYWTLNLQSGTLNGTYSLTLDITGVPGVNNPSTLRLLRRANASEAWTDLGTPSSVNGNLLTWTGLTSFSEYGMGGGGDNPLPVQLTNFYADANGRDVELIWQTATEVNSSYFEIERKSKKDQNYKSIGRVNASGNSSSPVEYRYVDKKLNSGEYVYRLKLVNNDGSSEYLREIYVNVELPKDFAISQNYPNPFNPMTKIDYQLPENSKVRIELYSITGQLVGVLVDEEQEAGYYTLELDARNKGLSSGVYIYRITAQSKERPEFRQLKKMVYLK